MRSAVGALYLALLAVVLVMADDAVAEDLDGDTVDDSEDACPPGSGTHGDTVKFNGCPGKAVYRAASLAKDFPRARVSVRGESPKPAAVGVGLDPAKPGEARRIRFHAFLDEGDHSRRWSAAELAGPRYREGGIELDFKPAAPPEHIVVIVDGGGAEVTVDGEPAVDLTRGGRGVRHTRAGGERRLDVAVATPDGEATCAVELERGSARRLEGQCLLSWGGRADELEVRFSPQMLEGSHVSMDRLREYDEELDNSPQVTYVVTVQALWAPEDDSAPARAQAEELAAQGCTAAEGLGGMLGQWWEARRQRENLIQERAALLKERKQSFGDSASSIMLEVGFESDVQPFDVPGWPPAWARSGARSGELAAFHRLRIERAYSEDVQVIRNTYSAATWEASSGLANLRAELLPRLRDAAECSPSAADAPLLLELMSMQLDQADEDWLEAYDAYGELEDAFDRGDIDTLPEPPGRDYSALIATGERLVSLEPAPVRELPEALWLLSFAYHDSLSDQWESGDERALTYYERLAALDGPSHLVDGGHFLAGDLHFDSYRWDEAISHYDGILDEREFGPYFERALYKRAWAKLRLGRLDEAVADFVALHDHAEQARLATGRTTFWQGEAERALALLLYERAETRSDAAGEAFAELDPETMPYAVDVAQELVALYLKLGRREAALAGERWLLSAAALAPEAPARQRRILELLRGAESPDEAQITRAIEGLCLDYRRGGAWWDANRGRRDAVADAQTWDSPGTDPCGPLIRARDEDERAEAYARAAEFQEALRHRQPLESAATLRARRVEALVTAGEWFLAAGEAQVLVDRSNSRDDLAGSLALLVQALREPAREEVRRLRAEGGPLRECVARPGRPAECPSAAPMSEHAYRFVGAVEGLLQLPQRDLLRAPDHLLAGELYLHHRLLDEAHTVFADLGGSPSIEGILADVYLGYVLWIAGDLPRLYDHCRMALERGEGALRTDDVWTAARGEIARLMFAVELAAEGAVGTPDAGWAFEVLARRYGALHLDATRAVVVLEAPPALRGRIDTYWDGHPLAGDPREEGPSVRLFEGATTPGSHTLALQLDRGSDRIQAPYSFICEEGGMTVIRIQATPSGFTFLVESVRVEDFYGGDLDPETRELAAPFFEGLL